MTAKESTQHSLGFLVINFLADKSELPASTQVTFTVCGDRFDEKWSFGLFTRGSRHHLTPARLSNIMSNMRSITVREVQHRLSAILERVQRGEQVVITRRGKVVARLVPATRQRRRRVWPDFEARMKRIFPSGIPKGKAPSELIRAMREERF